VAYGGAKSSHEAVRRDKLVAHERQASEASASIGTLKERFQSGGLFGMTETHARVRADRRTSHEELDVPGAVVGEAVGDGATRLERVR